MSAFEQLARSAQGGHSVGGYTFIDADTLSKDGQLYRIQGYDAPEISRFTETGEVLQTGSKTHYGTAGGGMASAVIPGLAQKQGFTNPVPLFNKDGSPQMDATGTRQMIELHDDAGRNFTTELLKSGVLEPTKYTSNDDMQAIEVAKLFGEQSDGFGEAADLIADSIESETLRPIEFRQAASDEAAYAAGYGTADLAFRKKDRSIRNQAYNPMSDSWEQGWIGAKEGAYGFLEIMGDVTDSEMLTDIGEAGVSRARFQQADYAEVLTDWKDVNGIKKGTEFLVNNAAMSLPYMITTAAATVAGAVAAPVVGTAGALAIGVSVPSAVYAGQTWNEMEGEKSASIALASGLVQGALDRLGIGAIGGATSITAAQGVAKIMAAKGITREAAETVLAAATKQELGDFLRSGVQTATSQLAAKALGTNFLKSAAAEGVTEVMQEATAYMGAVTGSDKEFDWNELNDRMIAAAVAGSALGGAFSVPGSMQDAARYRGILGDTAAADGTTARQSAVWAEQERAKSGYVATNAENLSVLAGQVKSSGIGLTLTEYADEFREAQRRLPGTERAMQALSNIPALWQGATRNIFTDDILRKSRSARVAADLYGGNPDRVFSGASMEDAKHHRVAEMKNMVSRPDAMYELLNGGKAVTMADKARISRAAYDVFQKAVDSSGNFDPAAVPTIPNRDAYIKLGTELNTLSDKMYKDQNKHNPDLGYIKNYLHSFKSLSKQSVHDQRAKFEGLLQSKFSMSATEAKDLTSRIIDDPNVGTIDEAYSVVKGGAVPSSHKSRTLALATHAEFAPFMNQDLFANVSHAVKTTARYTAHADYVGKDGSVVSALLDNMSRDGLSREEVSRIAAGMSDYLDAESGNYNRPSTEFGKKAQALQKHAMMFMTFSGLPLAVFSSFVEAGLISRGVDAAGLKVLKSFAKDSAKGIANYAVDTVDVARGLERAQKDSSAQTLIRDLGFYEWDVGAATVTGVTETNARHQKWFSAFFRANGLTQWTDYTRALRASFAGDFLKGNMEEVINQRRAGAPYSRQIQETELKLRNLGINIDRFIPLHESVAAGLPLSAADQEFYNEQVRDMTYNFVNEAIVLPQSANRPLIYQDPRFALFTQFQGFISVFTTKVLPPLYRDAFGGGTPTMQYSAWSTMMTMIMLGFLSQAIKDWIKYDTFGENDDEYEMVTGGNPYLDTAEYARRGLLSTGLLGVGERVLNAVFPMYSQRSDNPGDWIYNQAVGESPALGYVQRVAGAAGSFASGDVGRGVEQTLKATPVFGPFNLVNKKAGNAASQWNFNGE